MTKITYRLFAFICVFVLFVSAIGCASQSTTEEGDKNVIPVRHGNLSVTVSVDGNLVMPQAFDLSFGAPGTVQDVLVEEGDQVKAGAVLATLDHTLQTLDIQSANNSVQNVLSNLYETVPRLPQFPNMSLNAVGAPIIETPSESLSI